MRRCGLKPQRQQEKGIQKTLKKQKIPFRPRITR